MTENETRTLTMSQINKCFAGKSHQHEALDELYRLLYRADWDKIVGLQCWPSAGAEAHQYIGECFIRFDRAYHQEILPGGLWMNHGWSCDQDLGDWEVKLAPCIYGGDDEQTH